MRKAWGSAIAAAIVAGGMLPVAAQAQIQFQDTYVSIRNLWGNVQPGYNGTTAYTAGNISYANGYAYGSNFASLDLEDIGRPDGPNTLGGDVNGHSFEFYGVFRTVLSGNKLTHSHEFAFGPFSDIGFELGVDLDTQDDQFASYKRLLVAGPQFSINLPKGFWTISLHISKEWNTNAYLKSTDTSYNPTPELETAWLYPFNIGPVPLKFTGFLNIIAPKGKGAPDDSYHRTEILLHPKLLVDVGAVTGLTAPNTIDAGIGLEYWHNKFGNVAPLPGTQQTAVFLEGGYHF